MAETAKDWLRAQAAAEGFDAFAVTAARAPRRAGNGLRSFLAAGHHGTMAWMEAQADRRGDPARLWPEARSIVMLGLNYGPRHDPMTRLDWKSIGTISVYALGDDYHDIVKQKLKNIAGGFQRAFGHDVKVFVDTAPVMEKPLAQTAGIGWQGKHTNLVSREYGSWLFLGSIFTTAELAPDTPASDHCGRCRACLDICPTQAFTGPGKLDARRCISYLTIEHKGHIAREFRAAMGNRIYGCDDCLAVCPWNKFAKAAREQRLRARAALEAPALAGLARLDDAAFRALFRKSPVKRIGRDRFVRNVAIAMGNSGDGALVAPAADLLDDPSELVRAMAVWALRRLMDPQSFNALKERREPREDDAGVRREWGAGA